MRRLELPWRFLLPGIILPASVAMWLQYYMSVRASDDSQPAWAWYGSPISAALNFPAFVYSGPANRSFRMGVPGFKAGRFWIHPQVIVFFLLVVVHWYWIGGKVEQRWPKPPSKPAHVLIALYGIGAFLWFLFALGSVYAVVEVWLWLRHSAVFWAHEIYPFTCLLWSVGLSVYFSKSFVGGLRARGT